MAKFIEAKFHCPHCGGKINPTTVASMMGAKGGSKSRRKITPAQQRKMQEAKARKKAQQESEA